MSEQIHKRRKRYKGTHPRNFEDKYKELNPEKYGDTIQKVISNEFIRRLRGLIYKPRKSPILTSPTITALPAALQKKHSV